MSSKKIGTAPLVKDRRSVRCNFRRCPRRVYFDRYPIAIRCGYCLRVYCRAHALGHFGQENAERQAKLIARALLPHLAERDQG